MIGEMRETLLMQKSIRDAKFPQCRYVFFNEEGGRIGDFRKAWASACERSGVAIGITTCGGAERNQGTCCSDLKIGVGCGGWI